MPPGTPDEIQPPAQPIARFGTPSGVIDWAQAWRGILTAGLAAGLVSFVPILGIGFFLWALAAGAWAVGLYHRRRPGQVVTGGQGAWMGALTGAVTFVVYTLMLVVGIVFFNTGQQFRDAISSAFRDAAARSGNTPQTQELISFVSSPAGFATVVTFTVVVFLVIFLVSGAIGGLIGASTVRKRLQ